MLGAGRSIWFQTPWPTMKVKNRFAWEIFTTATTGRLEGHLRINATYRSRPDAFIEEIGHLKTRFCSSASNEETEALKPRRYTPAALRSPNRRRRKQAGLARSHAPPVAQSAKNCAKSTLFFRYFPRWTRWQNMNVTMSHCVLRRVLQIFAYYWKPMVKLYFEHFGAVTVFNKHRVTGKTCIPQSR